MRAIGSAIIVATGLLAFGTIGYADELSIYQIQYTDDPNGVSPYNGQTIDCLGGICIGKFPGSRPRVVLQDPAYPDGWGGIQVKDWTAGDLFDNVNVGDWVALASVFVEEYRGTTFLQWDTVYASQYTIVSQGNPVPPALEVSVSAIPAPLYHPEDDSWYVENHDAELYESMRLIVRDVTVTAMDLGKAVDNYNLQNAEGDDCWATDYMNEDIGEWGYHPFVSVGQHFCAVGGVLEQYTRISNGWDYYQLVTMTSADLAICGDVDHDGDVDLTDLAQLLANYGTSSGASYEEGDLDDDGDVDLSDLATLLSFYGTICP
jgi:hypothetical protein